MRSATKAMFAVFAVASLLCGAAYAVSYAVGYEVVGSAAAATATQNITNMIQDLTPITSRQPLLVGAVLSC
jgi:CHASE3 domain sensor protein